MTQTYGGLLHKLDRALQDTIRRAARGSLNVPTAYRRSELVAPRRHFFLSDVLRRPGVRRYQLVENGLVVFLRHDNYEDSFVLDEVFGPMDLYAIPPDINDDLRAAGVRKITDLGGNVGLTALKLLSTFPDATLTVIEADEANGKVLEAALAANHLLERTLVIHAAACNRNGTLRFCGGLAGQSHLVAQHEDGIDVPGTDVLPLLQETDMLKMDIEGGEWAILSDPRLKDTQVRALCMEYHSHLCPGDDDATTTVDRLLGAAGFEIRHIGPFEDGGAILWAVRR